MPGEAGPPLTPEHATSTPRAGVDGVSAAPTTDQTHVGSSTDRATDRPTEAPTEAPTGKSEATSADTLTDASKNRPPVSQPAPADESRPAPGRRKRLFVVLGGVAVVAYATDQLSKVAALDVLADGEPRSFVGQLIRFKLIGNPGAALSLGAGNTWVMTAIAIAVLVAIVVVARKLGSRAWAIALGMLLGAALGNLTDRFVRPPGGGQGHVVDFIDYNRWFIGNVADIWIVSAAALIVILAMLGIGVDGRRDGRSHGGDENA